MYEIFRQLNREWSGLADADVSSWTASVPCLERYRYASEVLEAIRSDPNTILRALLQLAQGGNEMAGRIILQTMLGKLVKMSTCGKALAAPTAAEDMVACMWERIMCVPLNGQMNNVAARLALDTLHQAQRRWRQDDDQPSPSTGLRVVHSSDYEAFDYAGLTTSEPGSVTLIDAALDLSWLTMEELGVLRALYVDGLSSTEAAAAFHVSRATIHRRHASALETLRKKAHEVRALAA